MGHKFVGSANVDELGEADLCYDSAELTAGSGDTMGGRAVAGWKHLSRYNERRSVRAKVLEEIGEAVSVN
jgi:hypothetical protein